jgi:hypothetical protein
MSPLSRSNHNFILRSAKIGVPYPREGGPFGAAGESVQMDAMHNGPYRPPRNRRPAGRPHVLGAQRQNGSDPRRHYERYLALAREAASEGDTVKTEHWYQHAEHYFRMMKEQGG